LLMNPLCRIFDHKWEFAGRAGIGYPSGPITVYECTRCPAIKRENGPDILIAVREHDKKESPSKF
jgi:hypothetical protein